MWSSVSARLGKKLVRVAWNSRATESASPYAGGGWRAGWRAPAVRRKSSSSIGFAVAVASERPPARASARSAPRRSLPQNGSPSTTKNGAPNTPARSRRRRPGLQRAFHCGSVQTRSASSGSRPNSPRAPSGARRREVDAAAREDGAQAVHAPSRRGAGSLVEPPEDARRVLRGDRELLGSVNGTPAKRAERSKSCSEYSRLIGWLTGLLSSAAWKVTPSSIAASAPCARGARRAPRSIRRRCTNTATRSRNRNRSRTGSL